MSRKPEITTPDWPTIGRMRFWLSSGAADRPRAFAYHYGYLAQDKGQFIPVELSSHLGGVKWVRCPEVADLAELAWEAYEEGEVMLVQRKHGEMLYEYLAIRRG